jgi:hypothetical protein
MSRPKSILLSLAGGSMELCWMYAWAMFCFVAALHRPFPFLEGVCTFLVAMAVTRLSAGKGWRVVGTLALHAFVFTAIALRIIYITYFSEYPFLDSAWFSKLFVRPGGFLQWGGHALVFFSVLMFWIGGVTFARRSKTYFAVCSRLDIGLGAFFCLFVLKLLILAKGGERIDDPASGIMIYPFFLFSFFTIGTVRLRNDGLKTFMPRYCGAGIVAGFAVTVIAFGGGLILFFMSGLSATAQAASRALKAAAGTSSPYVEHLLRIFFLRGTLRPEPASSSLKGGGSSIMAWAKGIWWIDILGKTLGWTFAIITGALILAITGMIIFLMAKWFLSRGKVEERSVSHPKWFLIWIKELWSIIRGIMQTMRRLVSGYHRASELYNGLRFWGSRCGLAPAIHETPLEFGGRLQGQFPQLAAEIDLIVGAYNQETYGEKRLGMDELRPVSRAWRKLQNPLLWPARFKVRLFGASNADDFTHSSAQSR